MPRFTTLLATAAAMLAATVVPPPRSNEWRASASLNARRSECRISDRLGDEPQLHADPDGRRVEPYVAQIKRFGFDVGYTDRLGDGVGRVWSTPRIPPGGIAGDYGGARCKRLGRCRAASNQMIGGPGGSMSLDSAGSERTAGRQSRLRFRRHGNSSRPLTERQTSCGCAS